MDTPNVFSIANDSEHRVCPLTPSEHTALLQQLYEKCSDYVLLVDGHAVSPDTAEQTFIETPPGRSLDDKFIFGVFRPDGALVGMLEGMRDYPEAGIWWIGLLLIVPEARRGGLGRRLVHSFAGYARSCRCKAIMLGVVDENAPALRFWQSLGFTLVRRSEPRRFDEKEHIVNVMRLPIE